MRISTYVGRTAAIAVALLVSGSLAGAGEHPEHPTNKAKVKSTISKGQLAKAIGAYIKGETKLKGGYFLVYDQKAKAPLALSLVRVHKKRLSKVGPTEYFACADFKTRAGKLYDLDIFMEGANTDSLKVTRITVHKEDGKERYTWHLENGVWITKAIGKKGAEHPKEHPAEHPQ